MIEQPFDAMCPAMTHFISRFMSRSAMALCVTLLPFTAAADMQPLYLVVSANTPEKVAAVEPVVIDRSGLAIAPFDLRPTGGLSSDLAGVDLSNSPRPSARTLTLASETTTGVTPSAPAIVSRKSSRAGLEALTPRSGSFETPSRARPVAPVRPRVHNRSEPSAAPTYLLGVFR